MTDATAYKISFDGSLENTLGYRDNQTFLPFCDGAVHIIDPERKGVERFTLIMDFLYGGHISQV